jgi:hypothetical protein
MWQTRIVAPPARWTTIAVPFGDMMFTRRGRVELQQREINRDNINAVSERAAVVAGVSAYPLTAFTRIHSLARLLSLDPPVPRHHPQFGILLADGRNGPFRFEVQWLRALAQFDPSQYASGAEQLMEERRRLEAGAPTRVSGLPDGSAALAAAVQPAADSEWLRPAPQRRSAADRVSVNGRQGSSAEQQQQPPEQEPTRLQQAAAAAAAAARGGGAGKLPSPAETAKRAEQLRDYYRRLQEEAKLK